MKLRLPLVLASLLVAAISSTATATDYTWTGATDGQVHINTNWTPDYGGGTNWQAVWSNSATNTMIFNNGSIGNKDLNCSFNTISIGGLTVASGATGYTLRANGNNTRAFDLNGASSAAVVFNINEDFNFGNAANQWTNVNVKTGLTMTIAAGKNLEMYGALNEGTGKTVTVNGGGSLNIRKSINDSTFAADWAISGNSAVNVWNWTNTGNVVKMLGSGTVNLAADSTIAFKGSGLAGEGNANGTFTIRQAITGAGTVEIRFAAANGQHRTVDFGNAFSGTVNVTAGQISLGTAGGNLAANYGTGTLLLNDTTALWIQNVNGGGANVRGQVFAGKMAIGTGTVQFNFYGNTNTTLSGSMSGNAGSIILLKDGPTLITYTGDWSGYGGTYNNESGRTLFDAGATSVAVFKEIAIGGSGLAVKSGTVVLGTSGITGGGNFKVGTTSDWVSATGLVESSGTVTLAGSGDFSTGKVEFASGSVLTVNTNKYDTVAKNYTAAATTITLGGAVSGAGSIVKTGTGTLKLSAANTFTGGLTVQAGTLLVAHANGMGAAGATTNFAGGTTWQIADGVTVVGPNVVLNGAVNVTSDTNTAASVVGIDKTSLISGTGSLTKTGAGRVDFKNATGATYVGDTTISGGILRWGDGGSTGNNTGTSFSLGQGKIDVASGAQLDLWLHTGGGTTYKTVANQVNLVNNSKIYAVDGSYGLANVNVNTTGAGEAFIQSQWTKNFRIDKVTGSGNLTLLGGQNNGSSSKPSYVFTEADSLFTGKVKFQGIAGGAAGLQQYLEIQSDKALQGAEVALDSSAGGLLILQINTANATIAGLNSAGTNNSIASSATGTAFNTLTVNGTGSFNGAIGSNLNLAKTGTGTLTLTGTSSAFNGSLTVTGGTLDISGATLGNVSSYVVNGGTLTGNFSLNANQQLFNLTATTADLGPLNLNGGTINFAKTSSNAATAQYSVDALTFGAAATTFKFDPRVTLVAQTYTLMTLDAALSTTYLDATGTKLLSNLYTLNGVDSTTNTRYTTELTVSSDKMSLLLTVTGQAASLTWNTAGDGAWDHTSTGTELWTGAISTDPYGNYFLDGDSVTFGDVTGGEDTHIITINGTLLPSQIIVNADAQDYEFVNGTSGKISGGTGLVKSGDGKLTIGLTNDYTGDTVISGGTVYAAAVNALGVGGNVSLSGGAVLEFDSGALGGVTHITTDTGTLVWKNGATDDLSSKLTVTNDSSLTLDIGSGSVTFGTALAGTGVSYTKTGAGTLTLGQTGALKGSLTIDEGTVILTGGGGNGVIYGNVTVNDGGILQTSSDSPGYSGGATTSIRTFTVNEGGKWTLGGDHTSLGSASVVLDGGLIDGTGMLDFFGGNSSLTATGGKISTVTARAFRLRQANTNFTVDADSILLVSANLVKNDQPTEGLTKLGDGLMIVTGTNDYRGNTVIQEGTLLIGNGGASGTLGAGKTIVNSELAFARTGSLTVGGGFDGAGTIVFLGDGSTSNYILSGASTFSGEMNADLSRVTLGNATALGNNATVNLTNSTLDYAGTVATGISTINVEGTSTLSDVNGTGHTVNLLENAVVTGTGNMTVQTLDMANGSSLALPGKLETGDSLIVGDSATLTTGSGSIIGGNTFSIGTDSQVTFGTNTTIAVTDMTIGENSSLRFGKGSSVTGTIAGGITFTDGSVYSGFLDAGTNDLTFQSGSGFNLVQDDINQYNSHMVGLTTTGNVTIESGTIFSLAPNMDFSVAPIVWPDGPITLVSTTGGLLTIGGSPVVDGTDYSSYLAPEDYVWYNFSLFGTPNSLVLEIMSDIHFEILADTGNEQAISATANSLATGATTAEGEIAQLSRALALSTTSTAHNNLSNLSRSLAGALSGYVAQMENLRRHGFDILNRAVQEKAGAERLSYEQYNSTIWANAIGGSYKLVGDHNAAGNVTNVVGGTLGASKSLSEYTVAGVSFTYTNSDTRLDRGMGKTEADAYYLDFFTRYNRNQWNIVGVVTGGITSLDMERDLSLAGYSQHASGSTDGQQVYGLLQAGYEFIVSQDQNSIVEPFALITGGYSSVDGYSETGVGNAGLNVESQSQGLCSMGAGVRFIREYIVDADAVTRGRFEARAMVVQDMIEVEGAVDGRFIGLPGQSFHLDGQNPDRFGVLVGLGVMHPLSESTSVFLDLDGEFRGNASGIGGTLGLKFTF